MSHASASGVDLSVSDLFPAGIKSRALGRLGWVLALSVHAGVFGLAWQRERTRPAPERPPVEIEIMKPPPPPMPEPEPPAPKPDAPEPAAPKAAAARVATSAPPPAPARAGALHTAKDDPAAQQSDEPLDFTHDPNVSGFGAGVVAVGGTAAVGVKGAAPSPTPASQPASAARAAGEALTAAADLGRKPTLGEADPCRGYFPRDALDDSATASVLVVVGKTGAVSKVSLISETPSSQGFGAAARACMSSKRFTPALDREGRPTATAIRVNVRFVR